MGLSAKRVRVRRARVTCFPLCAQTALRFPLALRRPPRVIARRRQHGARVIERGAHRAEGVAEEPRAIEGAEALAAGAVDVGRVAVGEDLRQRLGEVVGVRRRAVADQDAVGVIGVARAIIL